MKKRVFAIGDVHGCLEELEMLLEKISISPKDQLIFLGDLVNCGPNSKGVIELVKSLPNAKCLMGNHEWRLLNYIKSGKDCHLKQSDQLTIKQLNKNHWDFIKKFKPYIYKKKEDILLVHGGLIPNIPWEEQDMETLSSIQVIDPESGKYGKRSQLLEGVPWAFLWTGPPFVIYGHSPSPEVRIGNNSICLDTGCLYGGNLTAYQLSKKKIYQVKAKQDYSKNNVKK